MKSTLQQCLHDTRHYLEVLCHWASLSVDGVAFLWDFDSTPSCVCSAGHVYTWKEGTMFDNLSFTWRGRCRQAPMNMIQKEGNL